MSDDAQQTELDSLSGHHDLLADLLSTGEDRIVVQWMKLVAPRIEEKSIDPEELENSIRKFVRHLGRRLQIGGRQDTSSAVEHGEQRFVIGYRLARMLEEYGHLLDAVEKVARDDGIELPVSSYAALARNVIAESAQAVLAFVEKEREERDRAAARRFAFVAHELRNPIQSLALGLQTWEMKGNATIVRPVFERAVGHLQRLVDREIVSALENSYNSRPMPEPEILDLVDIVTEVVAVSRPFAEPRGVQIAVDVPEAAEATLDRGMVWSIVTNLVRNAIKFTRENSLVTLRMTVDEDSVHLEVQDQCGGLAPGVADKIFESFIQVGIDKSGFGLGLGIVRQACVAHGGTVSAENRDDGCVFMVQLPRHCQPETDLEAS